MSVVARERCVEQYVARNTDATLAETFGWFGLNPDENGEERALVEDVLATVAGPDAAGEQGGAKA